MPHFQDSYTSISHYCAYICKVNIYLAGAVYYISDTFCCSCQYIICFTESGLHSKVTKLVAHFIITDNKKRINMIF